MPKRNFLTLPPLFLIALLGFAARESSLSPFQIIPAATTDELTPAMPAPEVAGRDWTRAHGDNASSGYSKLCQITKQNVRLLAPAWMYGSGDLRAGLNNPPGVECNPVVVDGVMYTATAGESLVALDAASGREIWRFKPEGRPALRGLTYWRGNAETRPRLLFGAGDWLYALDPKSGTPLKEFGESGRVRARSTVAPAVYRNVVVIPCWNVVRSFDVASGKALWQFSLLANPGMTWGADSWGGMALDEGRGIAYVSTGAPHPDFLGMDRRGDDLYADSVVALRAATGELLWHFQEVRHDVWDWDIPAPPNLVTVTRDGRRYDAVAQVTKIGNTLLLDRVSGKPLFPVRLRRAPESEITGERLAEWQPDIELPEPFVRRTFSPDQVTDLSPESHAFVMKKVSSARFGWFMPLAEGKPTIWYSSVGGAEWTGASFDPEREWLFVNANDFPVVATARKVELPPPAAPDSTYGRYCASCHGSDRDGVAAPSLLPLMGRRDLSGAERIVREGHRSMPAVAVPEEKMPELMAFLGARPAVSTHRFAMQTAWGGRLVDAHGYPGVKPPWGTLNAINLRNGRIEWKVPLGEYEELTKAGVPVTGTENFAATTLTASGILFCAGTPDRKIRAFDSRTGEKLWEYGLPFAAYAQPAVYEAGGREYVAIAAGGGGLLGSPPGDVYMAFALPR